MRSRFRTMWLLVAIMAGCSATFFMASDLLTSDAREAVRPAARVYWILTEIGALAVATLQLLHAGERLYRRGIRLPSVGTWQTLLSWLPPSTRDDAEGMIRDACCRAWPDR